MRSTDQGASWAKAAPLPGPAHAIWGSGPEDVYAVGGGTAPFIAHTKDHGKTWRILAHGLKEGWFHAVTGRGPGDVLVAGKGHEQGHTTAVLLRSTDGGKRWAAVPVAKPGMTDNEEIRNLCFSSSGTLYASMSYAVYTTRDLGKNWRLAVGVGTEVLGMRCFGADVYVGGRNRKMLHSPDDGRTWDEHELDRVWTDPALISIQSMFVAETGEVYIGGESYASGGGGTLLRRAP
jgi:photosystem II stability/assembly factor-like uncharacterized protein